MLGHKPISRVIALHLIALLFVIFNVSNIRVSGLSSVIPLFDLMIIFYFCIVKDKFAMWFIFLMGIWLDALTGNIIGITAFCYVVLVKLFLAMNHKLNIKETFEQLWKQFMFFCFLFLLMKWSILSISSGTLHAINVVVIQFILSSFFYVVMHKFFDYLSANLLEDD